MKCSDIPTGPIIEFIRDHGGVGCGWHNNPELDNYNRSVRNVIPARFPNKLVLAKLRKLINKGIIDGCACGCRGDFDLPGLDR